MSNEALEQFERARKDQLDRNEARKMKSFINQARGDVHGAGSRWPFELTQNAHDPGAREGQANVDIKLSFDGRIVIYEHNGKPFTMQDLAALLSGGSSKEFDSPDTTGRFGTGFLVTHVLSPQIDFTGILAAQGGYEKVSIKLDRGGDEKEIFANTIKCYRAIGDAPRIKSFDSSATARFTFETDNAEAARVGMAAFGNTLPCLYATCSRLGSVTINEESGTQCRFVPDAPIEREYKGIYLRERQFTREINGALPATLRAIWCLIKGGLIRKW